MSVPAPTSRHSQPAAEIPGFPAGQQPADEPAVDDNDNTSAEDNDTSSPNPTRPPRRPRNDATPNQYVARQQQRRAFVEWAATPPDHKEEFKHITTGRLFALEQQFLNLKANHNSLAIGYQTHLHQASEGYRWLQDRTVELERTLQDRTDELARTLKTAADRNADHNTTQRVLTARLVHTGRDPAAAGDNRCVRG